MLASSQCKLQKLNHKPLPQMRTSFGGRHQIAPANQRKSLVFQPSVDNSTHIHPKAQQHLRPVINQKSGTGGEAFADWTR